MHARAAAGDGAGQGKSFHEHSLLLRQRFFGESGLLENEPTAAAEQAHTTQRQFFWGRLLYRVPYLIVVGYYFII